MILSPTDAQLFYKLMWGLQYYVNQQRRIHQNVDSVKQYADLPTEKKSKVREALWKEPGLIQDYVRANPHEFTAAELGILSAWEKYHVKETCYILRHLKKGSIFIGNQDRVYMVLGILTHLEDSIPSYVLPHMVQAVLLPFKGEIIYDGLLPGYNLIIGSGIRGRLNYTYKVARIKGRIIASLEPQSAEAKPIAKPKKSTLPQIQELSAGLEKLKGERPLQKAALSLARASLELAAAVENNEELNGPARGFRKAANRVNDLLNIEEEE